MADNGVTQKTAAQAYLEVAVDHGVDYVFGQPMARMTSGSPHTGN